MYKNLIHTNNIELTNQNILSFIKSYGGHVISAMATAIKQIGLGQVDRLTLLDPGTKVNNYEVNGKIQQGLIHLSLIHI